MSQSCLQLIVVTRGFNLIISEIKLESWSHFFWEFLKVLVILVPILKHPYCKSIWISSSLNISCSLLKLALIGSPKRLLMCSSRIKMILLISVFTTKKQLIPLLRLLLTKYSMTHTKLGVKYLCWSIQFLLRYILSFFLTLATCLHGFNLVPTRTPR